MVLVPMARRDLAGLFGVAFDGQDKVRTALDMVVAIAKCKTTFGFGAHIGQELALEIIREERDRSVVKTKILDIPVFVKEKALRNG